MTFHGLAIDPGKNGLGTAYFDLDSKNLIHAEYINAEHSNNDHPLLKAVWQLYMSGPYRKECGPDHLKTTQMVIESPRVYQTAKQKGSQEDILNLALVVGQCMFLGTQQKMSVALVRPDEWKGNLEKTMAKIRIIARLAPGEMSRIVLPKVQSLQHNVWDAIGIGLHQFTSRGLRQ